MDIPLDEWWPHQSARFRHQSLPRELRPEVHEGAHESGGGVDAEFSGKVHEDGGRHEGFLSMVLGRARSHRSMVARGGAEKAHGMLKIGLLILAPDIAELLQ